MYSDSDTVETVGCPIRRSMDQSPFAAPHGLSQRTTSFIASQRQGIHRMLLRHLIVLMNGNHSAIATGDRRNGPVQKDQLASNTCSARAVRHGRLARKRI